MKAVIVYPFDCPEGEVIALDHVMTATFEEPVVPSKELFKPTSRIAFPKVVVRFTGCHKAVTYEFGSRKGTEDKDELYDACLHACNLFNAIVKHLDIDSTGIKHPSKMAESSWNEFLERKSEDAKDVTPTTYQAMRQSRSIRAMKHKMDAFS